MRSDEALTQVLQYAVLEKSNEYFRICEDVYLVKLTTHLPVIIILEFSINLRKFTLRNFFRKTHPQKSNNVNFPEKQYSILNFQTF